MNPGLNRAVFLDRDGVLNTRRPGYVNHPGDLEVFPFAAEAIAHLQSSGFRTVLVSNQGGVGKGHLTRDMLVQITERLCRELGRQGAGLDAVYYCLHDPYLGCDCRKPLPGMLQRAARELDLALPRSYFVGDMTTDIMAGEAAGVKTIFVRSGGDEPPEHPQPWAVCDHLAQAIPIIWRNEWERSW